MRITRFILISTALAWLSIVTFSYYIVHKPFTLDTLRRLGDSIAGVALPPPDQNNVLAFADSLGNVIVALMIFLLTAAVGRYATSQYEFASPLEAICLRAGIGLGIFSFATLGLGLIGLLNPPALFWSLFLLVAIRFRNDLFAIVRDVLAIQLPIPSRFERALAGFIAVSLIIAALFALMPPISWDSQTYHLVEPQHAIELGRIAPPPDIVYFSFPSLGEMLFLGAMILKSDIAAQMVHFGYLILMLGAILAFANRFSSPRVGWLACAILIAVPSLLVVSTNAYVDVMLVFYAFAAFYTCIIALDKSDNRWFVLTGVFAGMAMGIKYTGIFVPVAIFILILFHNRNRYWLSAASYLLSTMLFAAPWYLRNLIFTGNPVYPFLFGGRYWDAFRAEWFSRFGSGLVTMPLKILTAPWDATVFGLEGSEPYSATIGPLLLAILPLALFQIVNTRANKTNQASVSNQYEFRFTFYILVFSLALYLFWLYGIVESKLLIQTRLLYPAFPTLAIGAAIVFDRLSAFDLAQFSLQRFVRLLLVIILALTLLGYALAFAANNPLAFIFGAVSRDAFLKGTLGDYYSAATFINSELPRDSKIVSLWEPRSYYIHRAIQPDVILDLFEHRLSQTRDVDVIALGWQDAGYTHVLLYRKGLNQLFTSQYDPVSREDVQTLQEFLTRYAQLVYGEPLAVEGNEIVKAEGAPYAIYVLRWK